MKKIFSGKLLLALINLLLISGIVLACASGGWDEEYGVSNFTPEVFVDSSYSPFFLSTNFYYGIGHDENQITRFGSQNAADWYAFFGKSIPIDEFHYLLEKASFGETDSAFRFVSGKIAMLPDTLGRFGLFKLKKDKRLSAFLNYLVLAKKSEAFAVREIPLPWEEDSLKNKPKIFDATRLNDELRKGFEKSKDNFLRERYWFQLVRSFFFNGAPQDAINFFDKYQQEMPRNPLYFRTMADVAGAYYKLKDFSHANYYYSKVYDGCDDLKTTAHYSFHPQEEKDWKATLALCSSKDEQATLWQMLGVFYSDEKRAISEIYKLNPQSDKLDLLLARAVNKYEQKFKYKDVPGEIEFPTDTAENANKILHELITRISMAADTHKPWVWFLAAGYLNTLDQHFDSANLFYDRAEKILPDAEIARSQLRILRIINKIGGVERIDPKLENELVPDIRWLRGFENNSGATLRGNDAYQWLKQLFSSEYKIQNELVKSECFISNTTFYADSINRQNMKDFLAKKQKTPFEALCSELSAIRLEDILEFEAIQLTMQDKLDGAIEKMEKAGAGKEVILPANPFNSRLLDCHDCDQQAPQKIKYSKLSFLKKMKELKDNIRAGNDTFNNALLLANACYNISQYGNNRRFYECKILGENHSSAYFLEPVFRKMLLQMDMALKYYKMAMAVAKTEEEKAKTAYLIAKCERDEWYTNHVYNKPDDDFSESPMVDLHAMEGFKELKKYANTAYYKEVIKECGYFRSYTRLY